MIPSTFRYFPLKRLYQLAISKQLAETQHRHYLVNHAYPLVLSSNKTAQLSSNFRAMSSGGNRDLKYEDILELAKKKKDQIEKKFLLIDVREPDEIKETGLIPSFVHIPLAEVPTALKASAETFKKKYGIDKPSQDAVLVFSCRSGKRSAEAMKKALEQGYTQSKHYAGGWMDWESKTKK